MVRTLMRALARRSPNMVGVVALQARNTWWSSLTLSLAACTPHKMLSKIDLELDNHDLDLNDTLHKTRSSKDTELRNSI